MTAATIPDGWVRIADVKDDPRCIDLIAIAMEELAVVQALVMMHGQDAATRKYVEMGGHIRFDTDGEPIIRRDAEPRRWFG